MKSATISGRMCLVRSLAIAAVLSTTPLVAQDAAATYKAKCSMCHGVDGKGDTPAGKKMGAHDFASPEVQKLSDVELTEIIGKGKNKMPGYASKLKESEIKDLAAYVRRLGKGN
jgi:cytochrome c6